MKWALLLNTTKCGSNSRPETQHSTSTQQISLTFSQWTHSVGHGPVPVSKPARKACVTHSNPVGLLRRRTSEALVPAVPVLQCRLSKDFHPVWAGPGGRYLCKRFIDGDVKHWTKGGDQEDCFLSLPDAIFTTGSGTSSLIGRKDGFWGSTRPMTPLESWNNQRFKALIEHTDGQSSVKRTTET